MAPPLPENENSEGHPQVGQPNIATLIIPILTSQCSWYLFVVKLKLRLNIFCRKLASGNKERRTKSTCSVVTGNCHRKMFKMLQ